MEYDFAGLSADLLEKLEKRLKSFNKTILRDCVFALNIINDPQANERRPEILTGIIDLLNDQQNKSIIFYTETLNKVQRILKDNLN